MGAYWRGEISARQLRVLVEHLPPRSAYGRARHEGQEWGNVEALLWRIDFLLQRLDSRIVWTRGKRPKWPKWKQFPWTRDQVTLGDRGGRSTQDVLTYLASLRPKKKKAD